MTADPETAAPQKLAGAEHPHLSRFAVRGYEIDALGHVAHTVYMQYAEQARWECLAEAGLTVDRLLTAGVMPAMLETTISYRHELRYGDVVDVGCEFHWGERKTARIVQRVTRTDGVLAAEVTSVSGLLDLSRRRLVERPRERLRELAVAPELLGV
ncbi:acyl-CoA thioesterase [Pseudonocardia xinjiangensis]|uniref:Acyl-CoA thioesterase n=1 Tax=Pseudonocardia xinjiangensis TaxID=75289 RepID=A0ABX1R5Y6_9PSEU|nr:acyl-CoA thioesterase [Pseudonocardia xinjiangensis]NMH75813.1 acyl-CoA thioesterase [Pseudonocardia xinjiangensis]